MTEVMINKIKGEYGDYLRDESRMAGEADTISFPRTAEEVKNILRSMYQSGTEVTIQGSRTGIAAGAVPTGGHILNLSKMNMVTGLRHDDERGCFFIKVQPGVLLSELRKSLLNKAFDTAGWSEESLVSLNVLMESGTWFFPPDPTETSASIGGMAACNASGARSFHYGAMKKYVESMHVILADGDEFCLKRGLQKARGRAFSISTASGCKIEGSLPGYTMPDVKNASGYYVKDDMDLIGLFIGSEGTLGVTAEIELRLLPAPESIWGVMAFFPSEQKAIKFVRYVRGERVNVSSAAAAPKPAIPDTAAASKPTAIEYFNHKSLELLRKQKAINPAFSQIPEMPPEFYTAVYVEYHGDSDDEVGDKVLEASELLELCGGSEDTVWIAAAPREMERLLFFRHAVPEAVNLLIDDRRRKNPGLTKLSTDMAVPDSRLEQVMDLYNRKLEETGLESVMFGHIGNNHIHVNILPNSCDEYEKGRGLYLEWAREVIKMGGTVSAEHGIGKLKAELLKEMYGEEGIEQMLAVKRLFDPAGLLNKGSLFKNCSIDLGQV